MRVDDEDEDDADYYEKNQNLCPRQVSDETNDKSSCLLLPEEASKLKRQRSLNTKRDRQLSITRDTGCLTVKIYHSKSIDCSMKSDEPLRQIKTDRQKELEFFDDF